MGNRIDLKLAKVLLVNDDGIDAPGIGSLRRQIDPLVDLLVVAPMSEKSGAGCSLSLNEEMPVQKRVDGDRVWGYAVGGTPADCVKFALTALDGYRPDLVLSGINRGRNVGNSVWYSGTVAGALEATMFGLRAMAVSLSAFRANTMYFDTAARMTTDLLPWLLCQSWLPRTFWNLNVPNLPLDEIKAVRLTEQGTSFFVDEFMHSRSEGGIDYYKNVGEHLENSPEPPNSDDIVLDEGYASLSPLSMNLSIKLPPSAAEALEREWNQFVFGRPGLKET